jgi:hypothetical protein
MRHRASIVFGVIVAIIAWQVPQDSIVLAQKSARPNKLPTDNDEATLSLLSLEVSALQALYRFQMTRDQLGALRKLAEMGPKADKRAPGKGSDKVRKRLLDLRDALVDGAEERIGDLEEKLADLLDEEGPELDDRLRVTPPSIRPARDFLRTMRPPQIVSFLSDSADEMRDPLDTLIDVLDVVTGFEDAQWKDLSTDMIEELRWQLGGLDPERNKAIGTQVELYLKRIRRLSEKEIGVQREELQKAAAKIVAQTPPLIVVQNFVEHALAELISNPRLSAALDARLESQSQLEKKP